MARLRNIRSGAVVNVSDEKAARMGSEWEPVKAPVSTNRAASAAKK